MSDKTNKKPLYKRWYIILLCILLVATFIFNLKYTFVLVSGNSMNPTYNGKQVLIADKKDIDDLERFDVVIVYTDKKCLIKRVIGLPGETIEYKENNLYIDGQRIVDDYNFGPTEDFSATISENGYYCLGDNRNHSLDSRFYGEFTDDHIIAKVLFVKE